MMQPQSFNNSFRSFTSWVRNNCKLANASPRRIVFILIFAFFLFYYMLPYFYNSTFSPKYYSFKSQACSANYKEKYAKQIAEHDVVVSDIPALGQAQSVDDQHFPFVGNGMIGSAVLYEPESSSSLYLYYKPPKDPKTKLINLAANVLIQPVPMSSDNLARQDAFTMNFRQGIVQRLTCFPYDRFGRKRIFSSHQVIAHRSRPNVLLQRLAVKLEQTSAGVISDQVLLHLQYDTLGRNSPFLGAPHPAGRTDYKLYTYTLAVSEGEYIAVVIATTNVPETISVEEKENVVNCVTVLMKSDVYQVKKDAESQINSVVKETVAYMDDLLLTSVDDLFREHSEAWSDILHTGLTITTSTDETEDEEAPGIPDPTLVNATMYYILSSMDSKLHDKGIDLNERRDLMKRLKTPNFCYTGVATFHSTSKLWRKVTSAADVMSLTNMWALTLRYKGCANLLDEGAEGMLQAIVLSFGGLQFTHKDLQLHTDPDILHNEIAFHNVMYQDSTVDIAINTHHADSVSISVAVRNASSEPLYACEAGCTSDAHIIRVGKIAHQLPVYVTKPPSPILYLSYDRNHLVELHQTLHLSGMMRYEEHWEIKRQNKGLPWIFWIGIASLILLFHVFLIRLLIKEYYSSTPSLPGVKSSKGYLGVRGRLAS